MMGSERPLNIFCGREIQKSINASVKKLLDDKIRAAGLQAVREGGNGFYESTQYAITGANGTTFQFMGLRSNPESVKSVEGIDIAWLEEANTISQRSLDLLIPTVRKAGSEIWCSWNRRHKTDPVDNMFLGGMPPPGAIVRKVNWYDNPWFPDVLYEEMMWDKSRDRDKWLHIWEGEPVIRSEARVFQNWRTEDLGDLPPDAVPLLGADWGFAIDPTVVIECYVLGRTLYFREEAWKIKCTIDETPALFAGTDVREMPLWTNRFSHPGLASVRQGYRIVADSARPETIKYMQDRKFNIIKSRKGAGSVEDGIEFMKSHDIVVHPGCTHVADEMTHYSYKEDPLTDEVLPILADKKNHTIDACRYALENVRRASRGRIGLFGGETVKQNF
jgi:phage terminase large subunit